MKEKLHCSNNPDFGVLGGVKEVACLITGEGDVRSNVTVFFVGVEVPGSPCKGDEEGEQRFFCSSSKRGMKEKSETSVDNLKTVLATISLVCEESLS